MGDIVTRLDSLNEIVQDLLVFSRPRELRLAPMSVTELLEGTAALLKKDPAYAGIDVAITGDQPTISADPEQLKTVFLNLLLNAAQATGSGGHVRVSVAQANGACRVSITDEGGGISAEIRPKIFEPFFTTKHRGTGLGLPTAKRVVEAHRGSIEFESPPSGGTVVTVTLPVS
jgi:two-component system sensor histidine kinase AtoS